MSHFYVSASSADVIWRKFENAGGVAKWLPEEEEEEEEEENEEDEVAEKVNVMKISFNETSKTENKEIKSPSSTTSGSRISKHQPSAAGTMKMVKGAGRKKQMQSVQASSGSKKGYMM